MKNYVVAKANTFQKKDTPDSPAHKVLDKNGAEAIILSPEGGAIPFKRVMAGTVAQRQQLFDGGVYLLSWTQTGIDPVNGPQYQFENLGELKGLELIKTARELGDGVVLPQQDNEPIGGDGDN